MKLSVIIPCLKRDEKVERAIRSIGGGVDGLELELVVVEGEKPVGRARNAGLGRATGDYVAWIDGDDEVDPNWLSAIAGVLGEQPEVDVVALGMTHVGWPGRQDVVWWGTVGAVDPKRLLDQVYRGLHLSGNLVLFVTRRELWQDLKFDDDVLIGEDYLMVPRLLARAKKGWNLGRPLYRYICTEGSLVVEPSEAKRCDQARIMGRRLVEARPEFRRAAEWGVGASHYWTADVAALRGQETPEAKFARQWIRRHLAVLMAGCAFGRGLTLGERVGWIVRFASAALNCWALQRRHRQDGASCSRKGDPA